MDVRGARLDFVDVEFTILQLQLTESPQKNIRIFDRESGEGQHPAWWCRRGRGRSMLRAKCGLVDIELPEIGEIAEELDKRVQSEGNTKKR